MRVTIVERIRAGTVGRWVVPGSDRWRWRAGGMHDFVAADGRSARDVLEAHFVGAEIQRLADEPERYRVDWGASDAIPAGASATFGLDAIAALADRPVETNQLAADVAFLDMCDAINASGIPGLAVDYDLRVPNDPTG